MQSNNLDIRPLKTEKTFKLANEGVYTFAVLGDATKDQIIKGIKDLFNVDVASLTTLQRRAKKKMNWKIRKPYYTTGYKKVYAKLVSGQKLDLYK